MKTTYFYLKDQTPYHVLEVQHEANAYFEIAEAMARKKAKLMGKKLAGGLTTVRPTDNTIITKVRKNIKPYYPQIDKRLQKTILEWDEYEITKNEAEARLQDFADEELTLEKIKEEIYQDDLFWQDQWIFFKDDLTIHMDKRNNRGYWKAEGYSMGWQNRSGYKYFKANTGEELLKAILPNTNEFSIRIYNHPNAMKIVVSHHDSPTGETYIIKSISEKTYNKEEGIE